MCWLLHDRPWGGPTPCHLAGMLVHLCSTDRAHAAVMGEVLGASAHVFCGQASTGKPRCCMCDVHGHDRLEAACCHSTCVLSAPALLTLTGCAAERVRCRTSQHYVNAECTGTYIDVRSRTVILRNQSETSRCCRPQASIDGCPFFAAE